MAQAWRYGGLRPRLPGAPTHPTQLEQSEAKCEDALKTQKVLTADLENMHSELENVTRSKSLVDEQLYRLQFERADLLKRIDEDQGDLNDLMQKHKDLIAQSAADIGQIQELQLQLEETKKEKQKLREQLHMAQLRIQYLEQSTVERAIVSRQEAIICDLENKTEFQKVQIKRFEVLVIRLRDSMIKMGEELSRAVKAEAQQRENSQYYQQRLEELKAEMQELAQREEEASRRCMELEKYVEELATVRQTLQTDLETSIRRIADLQAALEEVVSSDSDTERVSEEAGDSERLRTASSALSGAWDAARDASKAGSASLHPVFPQKPYHLGDGEGFAVHRKSTLERSGPLSSSPPSQRTAVSPPSRDKLPSPSAALSEFVEELRRKRAQRGQGSTLHLGDGPVLPIFQTTRASSLRRGRASSDEGDLSLKTRVKSPLGAEGIPGATAGLSRSTSLKCISSEGPEDITLLPDKQKTRFGSCESLLESGPCTRRKLSSPTGLLSPTLRPRRPCLESSVDDAISLELGKEPLVFQNRQFSHLMEETLDSDPFSWKLPSLNYRRQTKVDFDDFLPAIRKSDTPSSGAAKDGKEASKHPGVHFEMGEAADRSFLSGIKTILKKSPEVKEDPAHLSDSSSSSSSIVSFKSTGGTGSGPRVPRLQGDGGERMSPEHRDPGSARRDDDVESIMRKYLQQ